LAKATVIHSDFNVSKPKLFHKACLPVKDTIFQKNNNNNTKKPNEFLYKMGLIITIEELAFCIVFILGLSLNLHYWCITKPVHHHFFSNKMTYGDGNTQIVVNQNRKSGSTDLK
jgi:hypothetical protein